MDNFYRIAGLTVKMNTFGRTAIQAEPYRVFEPDKVDITIDTSGYNLEQLWPHWDPEMREYISTGMLFYKYLLDFDGLRLHSSAVVVDDKCYLFTADSGTGKSTHTNLWLKLFGERAYILNDDKPALRLENGIWYAYGTPWSGKHDISRNSKVELAGIASLERGSTNIISEMPANEAINVIIKQVNRPKQAEYRIKLLSIVNKLFAQIPIWRLQCNMNIDAAVVSYEAMSGLKFEEGEL